MAFNYYPNNQKPALSISDIRKKAMAFLARREHSRFELLQKLKKYGEEDDIKQIIEELKNDNLQSDERYVKAKIYSMEHRFGQRKICVELKRAGICEDLILDNATTTLDYEINVALSIIKKKYKTPMPLPKEVGYIKEKSRRIRFLISRGFSQTIIMKALAIDVNDSDEY